MVLKQSLSGCIEKINWTFLENMSCQIFLVKSSTDLPGSTVELSTEDPSIDFRTNSTSTTDGAGSVPWGVGRFANGNRIADGTKFVVKKI